MISYTRNAASQYASQLLKKVAQAKPKGLLHLFVPTLANFPTDFSFYPFSRQRSSSFTTGSGRFTTGSSRFTTAQWQVYDSAVAAKVLNDNAL